MATQIGRNGKANTSGSNVTRDILGLSVTVRDTELVVGRLLIQSDMLNAHIARQMAVQRLITVYIHSKRLCNKHQQTARKSQICGSLWQLYRPGACWWEKTNKRPKRKVSRAVTGLAVGAIVF